MRLLRIAVKGPVLLAHIALYALIAALPPQGLDERFARWWCRVACFILGLRVRRVGQASPAPTLFVANHISWLEVVALEATTPVGFVAKEEVRRWPVVGRLAACSGTLFLRRHSARAASRTMTSVLERLAEGRSVAVFPEGTSTDGADVLAFKASMFEAPSRLGCDVQPVSVRYPSAGGLSKTAPFIGDDEFLPHLIRVLGEPRIDVELVFGETLSGHARTREELAHESRAAVVAGLQGLNGADVPGYSRSGERSFVAP